MQQTAMTYIQIYNGTLIHAPNVPAWKCDICGQTFFDPDAVRRIDVLAGEAGPPPNRHAVTRIDDPVSPAPAEDTSDSFHSRSK
jgi:YgiT-type zinc finger domain-containing protein